MTTLLWTIVYFVLALSPLIFLHELGHYLAGRWFGVHAEAFSIGFGRPVMRWQDRRGTNWQVGWLPLGGYVRFAGDMGVSSQTDPAWLNLPAEERNRTFPSKPLWQRALIVLAGPMANFLVAIVLLSGLFAVYGEPRIPAEVGGFSASSSAKAAGMHVGDRIVSIEGAAVDSFDDIALTVQTRAGLPTHFLVNRAGSVVPLTITPRLENIEDISGAKLQTGRIGIAPARIERVRVPVIELPAAAARFTADSVRTTVVALGQILTGSRSVKELGGPVKIATTSNAVAALGFVSFLFFMAMISINLGFINLLPIPMLDGGHLLFYAIEAVRRRPVPEQAQEWAYRSGLFALLVFMIVVTVNDLAGLGLWQGIAGLIG